MDLVSVTPAAVGAEVQLLPAAQEVLRQNFAEGVPKILDSISVDDGVNRGVGVRQNYGHVHYNFWLFQVLVKQREAVEDVDGQPADGKQSHNDGEGFGSPDLLLQETVVTAVPVAYALELDLSQLLPGHGEDLQVDSQHDEQRQQHADKEIEVDHVLHVHHTLKEALELATPM